MARSKLKPKKYGNPVYTWKFASSQPRGGTIVDYETRLEENGILRCNCPGWIFCKGEPGVKACRHTRMVIDESRDVLSRFRNGDTLEILNEVPAITRTAGEAAPKVRREAAHIDNDANSRIRYGRVIEID